MQRYDDFLRRYCVDVYLTQKADYRATPKAIPTPAFARIAEWGYRIGDVRLT